jgi:hypothetical protein
MQPQGNAESGSAESDTAAPLAIGLPFPAVYDLATIALSTQPLIDEPSLLPSMVSKMGVCGNVIAFLYFV